MEGVKFYLVPNLDNIRAAGLGNVIFGATVTGILYFEYRYRCDGDLRKLYGKGMYPCRRKY